MGVDARLRRNGQRRGRVVARDHGDADAGLPTQLHRLGHRWAQGVHQAHQPEELEIQVVLPAADTPGAKDPLGASVAGFLAAVRGDSPRPVVTGEEAARALDLALAVEQALEDAG